MQFSTISALVFGVFMAATGVSAQACSTFGELECVNSGGNGFIQVCNSAGQWEIQDDCGSVGCEIIDNQPFCG